MLSEQRWNEPRFTVINVTSRGVVWTQRFLSVPVIILVGGWSSHGVWAVWVPYEPESGGDYSSATMSMRL